MPQLFNFLNKKMFLRSRTSLKQKIGLVLFGLFLSFAFLEAGLRLGGVILLSIKEHRNLQTIKQKGAYRILCLGESTTEGQYPQLLEQVLNYPNRGVRFIVVDKGRGATTTPVILSQVEAYLAQYRPDMVITMMGCNDERVRYYQDIPEADTWMFRHCRVYRFGRIIYMHILHKVEEANLFGEAIKKAADPNSKEDNVYLKLGGLYREQGKFSQAEKLFKKAVELDSNDDNAYAVLGGLYREEDKLPQAEAALKKAIEINPKNANVYAVLGRFYLNQNQLFQAQEAFKQAIVLNPQEDYAYAGLGWLNREQGKFIQAEDWFKQAINLNPKNDYAYFGLWRLYREQGKFSQAEDLFKQAIELDPKDDNAYAVLGGLYREQGKFLQAQEAFNKAIELNPENYDVYRALLALCEEMGKSKLVKECAQQAEKLKLWHYSPVTVDNYRKLKEILDKRRIKLVCVQYPMRDVEPLKKIFEQDQGVIFVDNQSVFKEAVKKAGYKEYFRDMFAGDFGHCTEKGNRLLAQNIARIILKDVFNK